MRESERNSESVMYGVRKKFPETQLKRHMIGIILDVMAAFVCVCVRALMHTGMLVCDIFVELTSTLMSGEFLPLMKQMCV